MVETDLDDLKGMINNPCCPKIKAAVKRGACGKVIHICANCGKYIEYDYDHLIAKEVRAIRGASKKYRINH